MKLCSGRLFLPFQPNAQVASQGNFLMGGPLGFSTATSSVDINSGNSQLETTGTKTAQFNVAPSVGYFITDNFAPGIGLDSEITTYTNQIDLSVGLQFYFAGPIMR